ncbi:hypothetical protein SAMN02800692_2044 [Luteibacter sp. UNC138MFCol5.1]|nr:hypothetical protein SAMN02800692_2044 [Luteibacter sp. UNC138MFCol5.1]
MRRTASVRQPASFARGNTLGADRGMRPRKKLPFAMRVTDHAQSDFPYMREVLRCHSVRIDAACAAKVDAMPDGPVWDAPYYQYGCNKFGPFWDIGSAVPRPIRFTGRRHSNSSEMKRMKTMKSGSLRMMLLLSATACFSPINALAVDRRSAAGSLDVVAHLYRDHAWEAMASSSGPADTGFGPTIAEAPRSMLERYFEHHLVDLLQGDADCQAKHEGEVCNLDFNILFSSQDPAATDLTLEATGKDRVMVSFTYPSDNEKIRIEYITVETQAGWRIKDVIFHNMKDLSLAEMLGRRTPR